MPDATPTSQAATATGMLAGIRGMFYGWVIVAVSFMGNWITAPLNPVVFSIFIVPIRDEFHVTMGAMALIGVYDS